MLELLKKTATKEVAEIWQYEYGSFLVVFEGNSFKVYNFDPVHWPKEKLKSAYTPEWMATVVSSNEELRNMLNNI